MFEKYWKVLTGVAATAAAGVMVAAAILDDEDNVANSVEPQIDESATPWKDQLVATDCPKFPGKDGANLLQGNWIAQWDGVPEKNYFIGGQRMDAAHLTIQRDELANQWTVYGPSWYRGGAGSVYDVPETAGQINPIELEAPRGGTLRTSFSFYSAPDSTLSINPGSPDRIAGSWEMRDTSVEGEKIYGTVAWDRATPSINRVVVTSEDSIDAAARVGGAASEDFCGSRVLHSSEPLVATMSYSKDGWSDEFNVLRANRPSFTFKVYGDNLWGKRNIHFDWDNTGIEFESPRRIRSTEQSSKVIGLSFDVNIWYDVQPGWYTLYIDDMAIPFQLDIPNWTPEVSLEYVNYDPTNDTERVLEEIPINQAFWVRATVKNPERFDDTQPLVLYWKGEEYSAPAMKTAESIYRAGPYLVSENLLPSTMAPADEPCIDEAGGAR